jgi:hypothetical protein
MAELGLMYDDESAVAFAAAETAHDDTTVRRVLAARDLHLACLGVTEAPSGVDVEALRAANDDIVTADDVHERRVTYEAEAAFVLRMTRLSPRVVVAVLAADVEYMSKRGLVDPNTVPSYRAWARRWIDGS